MVLVRRLVLVLFGLVVVIGTVLVGVYGYVSVETASAATVAGHADAAKVAAENVLFAAIVFATVILVVVSWLIGRSIHVSRELDKLVEMSKYSGFSPEISLRRLGSIGEKLNAVYHEANAVSESKSVKITALSALNDFLVANLQGAVLVVDVTGRIVQATRALQERLERNRNDLIGLPFHEVFSEPAWNDVEVELVRLRTSVARESAYGEITFYPIENRNDEIAYVVCSLGKSSFFMLDRSTGGTAKRDTGAQTGFRRIVSTLRRQVGRPSH